ncbi:MIP/aquaporin family protein [Fulvivirga lutimaris]|uniref:MIP/aquaporin family protein n=1 Tax=Fulvivirga lutimaris TaxID=1819566 RepID=UPI0012BBFCE6|nr:aquaporin [Fulvivirga lutimaris]MTI40794.1 aquaporin [Fulvivirga lutimaris]
MTTRHKAFIAEFIGTFALVFCGTGAIVINDLSNGTIGHAGIAIVFGAIVMAIIYCFGELSGAHINPAVTLSFWLAKRFDKSLVLPYIVSQLAGALFASLTLMFLFPTHELLGATLPTFEPTQSFVLELIMSYILMLVIIQVSSGSKETGTMAGMAIGGVVLLEAMFGGPISGASMNPARSFGPAIASGHLEHLWLYLLAPILGMFLSIFTWRLIKT